MFLALYVEQIPVTEAHRGLCINNKNSDKLLVLNKPLNYTLQDFTCYWDHSGGSRKHPESLLNITSLSVVRDVLDVMDFGQKYWLSDISESVYSLVHQCEVFNHVGNFTLNRKSNTAMHFCDEMNNYQCIDGKKYRTAVSLVKYLYDRHGGNHDQTRIDNSERDINVTKTSVEYISKGDLVWKVSSLTLSGGIVLIGLLATCLKIMRSFGSLKKEKRQVPERRLNEPVYDDDWVQMKQTASLKHGTAVLPSGSTLSKNIQDT
ncbi:Hypothetical predicted protein [Mytilus galloprovincialis]|uniref:Uncharacterized protein n=1 Tax=Mytilus galloprovincialis TaxID=29158 RepID=A0A8B6DKM8_MYTGA|nr:Hypothetical predicted protein [Mytilus galloprovincialis]